MSQQEQPVKPDSYPDISQYWALGKRKGEFIKALCTTNGNITQACHIIGMARQTHLNWLASDDSYAAAYAELSEMRLDLMEELAERGAKEGNATLLIFWLKNKGASRGFHPDSWHTAQALLGKDSTEAVTAPHVVFEAPDRDEELPK